MAEREWIQCFPWMQGCFSDKMKRLPSILEETQRETRSLSGHCFRQVISSRLEHLSPNLLLCCHQQEEGVGSGGGRKSQKESQNKLSYPPSSPASGKMCRNNSILFIISGFVSLWSTDKELSITVPAGDLRIPLCPDTICSRFTLSSTQRQCQGTNFLLPSWIKNLIHLPLCTSIKADKSGEEAHYQAVLSASTVV